MKIVIAGSISYSDKIIQIADQLEKMGHTAEIPYSTKKIKNGELKLADYIKLKKKHGTDHIFRQTASVDLIKDYYEIIKKSDAVLVLNLNKNRIRNYIGGNTLMELAFAYVLEKPIYLYNPVPKMPYTDEILAVNPIIINQDLSKIS